MVVKMHEVSELSPQTVGPLTVVYHRFVPLLKRSPWKVFFAGSFAATLLLYIMFGAAIVYLVNVLQYGF